MAGSLPQEGMQITARCLQVYGDFLRIVLEVLNCIIITNLPQNPELVYALLHRQEVFMPFRVRTTKTIACNCTGGLSASIQILLLLTRCFFHKRQGASADKMQLKAAETRPLLDSPDPSKTKSTVGTVLSPHDASHQPGSRLNQH